MVIHRLASPIIAAVGCLAVTATPVQAGERCEPPDRAGNVYCEVGIPSERLEPITAQQKKSQWCWAASISMLFAYHKHPVSQERIVKSVWGRLADLPAMSGSMMTEPLVRPWADDSGQPFQARVKVYDADAGEFAVDERMVIDELRDERPLLLGTVGHAMVLTALRYVRSPWGDTRVLGATVRDPWPGTGRRDLEWDEMDPAYVATIDIAKPPAPRPDDEATVSRRDDDEMRARSCGQACRAEAEACESAIPEVQACLEEAVAMCVDDCVYEQGLSQWNCEQRLCNPRSEANRQWQAFCETQRGAARDGCREAETLCVELCL